MKNALSIVRRFGIQAKVSISPEGHFELTLQAGYAADKKTKTAAKKKTGAKKSSPSSIPKPPKTRTQCDPSDIPFTAPYKAYAETADIPWS